MILKERSAELQLTGKIAMNMSRFSHKKLNQLGFDHILLVVSFVVLFAIIGSYLLIKGHAASWTGELQLGSDRSICMNDNNSSKSNGTTIGIYSCENVGSERWYISKYSNGEFQLKNGTGICADDWGYGVSTSTTTTYLKTYACQSNNGSELWEWNGHELENASTHGCINDPAYSKTNGKGLIIWPCAGSYGNEQWFEAGMGSVGSSSSSGSGGSTSTSGLSTNAATACAKATNIGPNTEPSGTQAVDWAVCALDNIPAPLTTANIQTMDTWFLNEGVPHDINNPLNTYAAADGSTVGTYPPGSTAAMKIQDFPNAAAFGKGIAEELHYQWFPLMLSDFKSGKGFLNSTNPTIEQELKDYCGGGYDTVPADYLYGKVGPA